MSTGNARLKVDAVPSLLGSDLPECIWVAGLLHLPAGLVAAHRTAVEAMGYMSAYIENPKKQYIIGGSSEEEAKEHFVWRFLNSAARSVYVCADPLDENTALRDILLEQLAEGRIQILDVAAGHGAGTLAILSLIGKLRELSIVPRLPVNIAITAIDFSPSALTFYQEGLDQLRPPLAQQGIFVDIEPCVSDLCVQGEVSQVLDNFFEEAHQTSCTKFLCVLSAISGVGPAGASQMHGSLTEISSRLSNRPGSAWIWIEPAIDATWFASFLRSIELTWLKVKHKLLTKAGSLTVESDGDESASSGVARKFRWWDPYQEKDVHSYVRVHSLKALD